jgi:hypothetical protein
MVWNQSGVDGDVIEAEKKAREEKEKQELEAKEAKDRDDLYNAMLAKMQSVKLIEDLASIWTNDVMKNKVSL